MKKVLCLLFVCLMLNGCNHTPRLTCTYSPDNLPHKSDIQVDITYDDNKFLTLDRNITIKNVSTEQNRKYDSVTREEELTFLTDKKNYKEGIRWTYGYNLDKKELTQSIHAEFDTIQKEDLKNLQNKLPMYDFNDVNKTRKALEKEGYQCE